MSKEKGFVLLMVMFLMLFMATIGLNTMMIFRSSTIQQSADTVDATASYSSLQAGVNWVVREFYRTDNWPSLAISLNNMTLTLNADCTFLLGTTANALAATVNITGNFHTLSGAYLKRTARVVLNRTTPGSGIQFAVFSPVLNTKVSGDIYLAGGVVKNAAARVNPGYTIYYQQGRSETGTGYGYAEPLLVPYPTTIPTIDIREYEERARQYDAYQVAAVDSVLALTGLINLTTDYAGLLSRRGYTLGGNCTINGSGVIFAARNFLVNSNFNLCISPNAGQTITIISRRAFTTGSTVRTHFERCTLYNSNAFGAVQMTLGANTFVTGCVIMTSENQLLMNNGAQVRNSRAFCSERTAGLVGFNLVATLAQPATRFQGMVIANNSRLAFNGLATVSANAEGFFYSGDTTAAGSAMDNNVVTGCVIANLSGTYTNTKFIYDREALVFDVPTNCRKYAYGVTGSATVKLR
ncbi:MAG: hypothetical protein WC838_00255 [Candidatus Margulisiibacteriota bacterium]|jgi:hypothetical protein